MVSEKLIPLRKEIVLLSFHYAFEFICAIEIPQAEASDVVLTDPIQIVNSGTQYSDRMMAIHGDSNGNIHLVFSRNTQHLYYQMQDPRGEQLMLLKFQIPAAIEHGILIS